MIGRWRGDELDSMRERFDTELEAHDERLDRRERFGVEGFCFECGSVTDHRTGKVFCCHKCRAGFREDEAA